MILLVEDDPLDAQLVELASQAEGLDLEFTVVTDVPSAIAYLRVEGDYANATPAGAVVVDLGLPGANGRELIRYARADERTVDLPIVVLSGSDDPSDMSLAYDLGATAFVHKPTDVEGYQRLLKLLAETILPAGQGDGGPRRASREDYQAWATRVRRGTFQ